MNCPECHAPLTAESHHGIQLDVCDRCQGLWFDRGELDSYWSASSSAGAPPIEPTSFEAEPGSDPSRCPNCETETLGMRWVDVFIGGACSTCHGVWLTPARGNKLPQRRTPGKAGGGWLDLTNLDLVLDLLLRNFR